LTTSPPILAIDISSWAYDHAVKSKVAVIDNRAIGVACYNPGHTLIEKLQAISTKYRKQVELGKFPPNFLRHYYDVYCLLAEASVLSFIGTDGYLANKKKRFRSEEPDLTKNDAFVFSNADIKRRYAEQYDSNKTLYYKERPSFDAILERIRGFSDRL
jgi:hypothetical protein